jgi:hypothetical protein
MKDNEMGRVHSIYRGKRTAYRVLVRKPEGTRPLGRPRCRWQHNNFKKMKCHGMQWNNLAQDRDKWWALVNAVQNF